MLKFTAAAPKWEEPSARTQHPWPAETQSGLSLTVLGPRGPGQPTFPQHHSTAPTATLPPTPEHLVCKEHGLQGIMCSCLRRNVTALCFLTI